MAEVVAAFTHPEDAQRRSVAEIALDRHFVAHGWGGWIRGSNPIPFSSRPACDIQALDSLLQAALACPDEELRYEALKVAAVLERNGRTAAAELRAAYEAAGALAAAHWWWDRDWADRQRTLGAASAEEGRWDWAYYHYSNYNPGSMCGNAVWNAQRCRNERTADCLLHLERWEELRALCRHALNDMFCGSPCFVELLVESYYRQGRPDLIEADLAAIRDQLSEGGRKGLRDALTHREILQLSDDEAFQRIPELLNSSEFEHFDRVDQLLERAGSDGVCYWVDDLERRRPDWTFYDLRLLHRLAATGDAAFRLVLDGWLEAERDEQRREDLIRVRDAWDQAVGDG